jgi:hypothetical protein
MSTVSYCPVSIPKSGNKIIIIAGRKIFARQIKGIVTFYDVNTKVQLCSVQYEKFDYAVSLIKNRIGEVKDELV